MADVNTNVYTILNSAVTQAFGDTAETINAGNFVNFGKTVMQIAAKADAIFNTLVDRIGKTVVMTRVYTSKWRGFLVTELEYGTVLQRIRVEPMDADEGEQFIINDELTADNVSPFMVKLPKIMQSLFTDTKAYQFRVTVPREQLKTAFVSEQALAAFIEGIYTSLSVSVEKYIETATRTALNTYIAQKYTMQTADSGKLHAINLLAMYNAEMGGTLTAAQAFTNADFLRWAAQYIGVIRAEMGELSTVFNDGTLPAFDDNPRMVALSRFEMGLRTFVLSAAYNADEIPAFNPDISVSGWQAVGDPSVKISFTAADGTAKTVDIIPVAVMMSARAVGATVFDHSSDSIYNPRRRYYNVFEHITCGYFADLYESGTVFYIADATAA